MSTVNKLKYIKVAGFKSFVDPTTLHFKGRLTGVVGPNGCGKSNIIDAVRWVMGEGSAKNLRGDSMAAVIFNGSSGRKPVGLASVDLGFDNSEGGFGGEYSKYNEICIRREVTRDGQSNYYLNGTRCRRRDIIDIFLGTGLGPRSYSIIGQGMISDLISAKPEEMRIFIEEAAGTTIYKKRRHETGLRMKHTTENLERISDLCQELEKQLSKLKRQSESAREFKILQSEKELFDTRITAIKYVNYTDNIELYTEKIRTLATELEKTLSERSSTDTNLEKIRLIYTDKNDELNLIQVKFYSIGAEIAKKEQILQHSKEKLIELSDDLKQTVETELELINELEQDNSILLEIEEKLLEIAPSFTYATMQFEQSDELFQDAELDLQNWNEEWNKYQNESKIPQQQAEVEKEKLTQLEKQARDAQIRSDRLKQEHSSLNPKAKEEIVNTLQSKSSELEEKSDNINNLINNISEQIDRERQELKSLETSADEIKLSLQSKSGTISSLKVLQEAALGKNSKNNSQWLENNKILENPKLAEKISVEPGFELCVELILADYLQAILVDDIDYFSHEIQNINNSNLILFNNTLVLQNNDTNNKDNSEYSALSLIHKVTTDLNLNTLLNNIFVVDNLEQALKLLSNLTDTQSIITKDGVWLSKSWIKVQKETNPEQGVLQRKEQLELLESEQKTLSEQLSDIKVMIDEKTISIQSISTQLKVYQEEQQTLSKEFRTASSDLSAQKASLDHILSRISRITEEIEENTELLQENAIESASSREILEAAIDKMTGFAKLEKELLNQKEQISSKLKEIQHKLSQDRDQLHSIEIDQQTLLTRQQSVKEGINRATKQLEQISARKDQLEEQLTKNNDPDNNIKQDLDLLLTDRLKIENKLDHARTDLESVELEIKQYEKNRFSLEKSAEEFRNKLEEVKMKWQSFEVKKENIVEYAKENKIDLESAVKNLRDNANEELDLLTKEEILLRLDEINKKIEKLGPINLAAIEEYEAESERKIYLDAQYADLTEALNTLEEAISKIDKETKIKFKETFDKVNETFKVLFPKLFGGGESYLELVGDDLLESGVTVMARPPGKKNSSIHLLSGGEKALTAVALVFSIFQLNPAPFCMLDEVDAPLDDSNVVRFCKMVKEMSEKVQFIFITHNKVTMELANQLSGVTMKEPGVSRLVTVDIEEAVDLALS